MIRQVSITRGFTIIELSLAMTFVSVLLLAIVLTAMQAGRVYNKGLVLESVNQAGRDIGDTIRRDFLDANAAELREWAGEDNELVTILGEGGSPRSGRFCLGNYSYVWNVPDAFRVGDPVTDGLVKSSGDIVNFVRVSDQGAALCSSSTAPSLDVSGMAPTSLLDNKGNKGVVLAIYNFSVQPVAVSPGGDGASEGVFRVNYTIGTSETGEIASGACRPPADETANDQFCAINKFEMIVRTNGQ